MKKVYIYTTNPPIVFDSNLLRFLASSVVRMMSHMFGIDIFRKSLHDYIAARSFNTTNPTQLYDSFQRRVTNAKLKLPSTVNNIMETWTSESGYPLVTVTRDTKNASIILSQKHFLQDEEHRDLPWPGKYIPITVATSIGANFSDTMPDLWMVPKINTTRRPIPGMTNDTWIIVNKQESGYYRVNYDPDNWKLLTAALQKPDFDKIHNLNRASLIDDAFNLARAGEHDFSIALDLMHYLHHESDYAAWAAAYVALVMLEKFHRGHSSYNHFEQFVRDTTVEAYAGLRLVTDERDHLSRKKRGVIGKLACRHGLSKCIEDTKIVFRDIVNEFCCS